MLSDDDCKDQFNRISPYDALKHFDEAAEWLGNERPWRASQMFWSIHKHDKCLDGCGKANAYNFDIMSHEERTTFACKKTSSVLVLDGAGPVHLLCPWVARLAHKLRTYTAFGNFIYTNNDFTRWASYLSLHQVSLYGPTQTGAL